MKQRYSFTFTCRGCDRATCSTGQGNEHCLLCIHCYDIAGIEEYLQDGSDPQLYRAEYAQLVADCKARGGTPKLMPEYAHLLDSH